MIMKKCFGVVVLLIQTIAIYGGELKINVGAKVETDFQIWYLDSIVLGKDSTTLKWRVESKGDTYAYMSIFPTLTNPKNNQKYYMRRVWGITKEPKKTMFKLGEMRSFVSVFSKIPKSTKSLDYFGSDNVWVKGINLKKGGYKNIPTYISLNEKSQIKRNVFKVFSEEEQEKMLKSSERLFDLGMALYTKGAYNDAIKVFRQVSDLDSTLYRGIEDSDYWRANPYLQPKRPYFMDYSKMWIASSYYMLGLDSLAKNEFKYYKVIPFDRKLVKKTDSILIDNNLFKLTLDSRKNQEFAYKTMCSLDSLAFGTLSYRYAFDLKILASHYSLTNNIELALDLLKKSKSIMDAIQSMDDDGKYNYYSTMFDLYIQNNNHLKAIECLKKITELSPSKNRYNLLNDFENSNKGKLVSLYMTVGFYDEALKILKSEVDKKKISTNQREVTFLFDRYLWSLYMQYAKCLFKVGYRKEALRVLKSLGLTVSQYANVGDLLLIGDYYKSNYDRDMALKYYQQAEKMYNRMDSLNEKSGLYKFSSLRLNGNRAVRYVYPRIASLLEKSDICSSIELQKENVKEEENSLLNNKLLLLERRMIMDDYTTSMSKLAWYYLVAGKPDSSIVWEKKNIEIKKQMYQKKSQVFGLSYLNLGEAYAAKTDYVKALEYTDSAMVFLSHNLDLRRVLANLVKYSYACGKKKKAAGYLYQLYCQNRKDLQTFFEDLTLPEKNEYLKMNRRFYQNFMPQYAEVLQVDSLNDALYDGTVFFKGILLNSEQKLKSAILGSKDARMNTLYEQLRLNKRLILNSLEQGMTKMNIDSLERENNILEDSLLMGIKAYKTDIQLKNISWRDIQKKLGANGIAIEFLAYESLKKEKNDGFVSLGEKPKKRVYAALLIKKEYRMPKLVVLCENSVLIGAKGNVSVVENLIWKPLMSELQDVDSIYFSPTDQLHTLAIEYSPLLVGKNVFRLTSTRLLAEAIPKVKTRSKAILFGDIDYDASPKMIEKLDCQYNQKNSVCSEKMMRGWGDDLYDRGYSFYPLEYSKEEIINGKKTLRKKGYQVSVISGVEATEESFKELSGKGVSILHISTHGAYIPSSKVKYRKSDYNMNFLVDGTSQNYETLEDICMTHSFLMMAGGNRTLSSDTLYASDDDGILTAQEISQVDLQGLQLVVLSACETGLGDSSNDGVIGLGRGLKKAGAKAIMMSLQSVNDKETMEFMSLFYQNFMNNDIHVAFRKTIDEMKARFPYNSERWRSFILLDAI